MYYKNYQGRFPSNVSVNFFEIDDFINLFWLNLTFKKARKIWKNLPLVVMFWINVGKSGRCFSNFFAFSQYLNCTNVYILDFVINFPYLLTTYTSLKTNYFKQQCS